MYKDKFNNSIPTMNYLDKINASAKYLRERTKYQPAIGMILGSGLGSMANQIENPDKIAYEDIPNFPVSTVAGHNGQLVIGTLYGKTVIAMQGRVHLYEGVTMQELTFPVRVMQRLGVQMLIVTNACGGLNPDFYAGGLMFIQDHLNLMGDNPLIGKNFEELGPRFPDMSAAYDPALLAHGQACAKELGIETFEGIYSAISGPYYLGKAELRMLTTLGADTVGMSTIPETIVAVHGGMKVLGISCITDMAVPDDLQPLTHEHVVEIAAKVRPKFIRLVSRIIEKITL